MTWPIQGGGSPDMGNVSADGKFLWLSGRYDDVVYVIDTNTGNQIQIPVGNEPHGLVVGPLLAGAHRQHPVARTRARTRTRSRTGAGISPAGG